jgi:hypothetical protein
MIFTAHYFLVLPLFLLIPELLYFLQSLLPVTTIKMMHLPLLGLNSAFSNILTISVTIAFTFPI